MITFIYGGSGCGKTAFIEDGLVSDLKVGGKVILLVPEQQAVISEQSVSVATEKAGVPSIDLEVLNFKRLANRVFREYGGLQYENITEGGRALLVWKALFETLPALGEYASGIDSPSDFIPVLLDELYELKRYRILPSELEKVASELPESSGRLRSKLSDLALIYSAYENGKKEGFEDSADDLIRLSELLEKHEFFAGKNVYIDSFSGFSPIEYEIIRHIFSTADNVTVSLCFDPGENQLMNESIRETSLYLHRLAAPKETRDIVLRDHPRYASPELAFLEAGLFETGALKKYDKDAENISIFEAQNQYEEAEIAACRIRELIEGGAKYKDIAVIMRSEESYAGIIDSAFEKYGIPFHFSRRVELDQKPVFKLILSALNVKNSGLRLEDMTVYLKTGLSGLTSDEADVLSNYAYRWNISGKRWTNDGDWIMNPDGYTSRFTEQSAKSLEIINSARRKVAAPLSDFFTCLDGKHTVKDICSSLYDFLMRLEVPQKMEAEGGEEDLRLFGSLCTVLDQMVKILPDLTVNASQFYQLISLVIRQTDVGTLPSRADEITIGSSSRLKMGMVKHAILVGVNEGIFPCAPSESGLITDREKTELEAYDMILSPKTDLRSSEELFYFYKSASLPSDTLSLIYSSSTVSGKAMKPSMAIGRIKALFPSVKEIKTKDIDPLWFIRCKKASFEHLMTNRGTELGEALERIYSEDGHYRSIVESTGLPLTESDIFLSEETVKALYPSDLALTQSSLEAFARCPLRYHCTYTLGLSESERITFGSADIGTFTHHVLEKFLSTVTRNGKVDTDIPEDEIERLVDRIISDYLDEIFGQAGKMDDRRTNRVMELFLRLRKNVLAIIKNLLDEFRQSDFVPLAFEMKIAKDGGKDTVSPFRIPLSDGHFIYIYGVIDRVDVYKKGDDVYFRIVDYKKSKSFSMKDIELGLNLQMLLYLFSCWKDESGHFREMTDCKGEIKPAAILYSITDPNVKKMKYGTDPADIMEEMQKKLSRTGMILKDSDILHACERALSMNFIPVKENEKDGAIVSKAGLELIDEFGSLLSKVSDIVGEMGDNIKKGKASAEPLKKHNKNGCDFCKFRPICRKADPSRKEAF